MISLAWQFGRFDGLYVVVEVDEAVVCDDATGFVVTVSIVALPSVELSEALGVAVTSGDFVCSDDAVHAGAVDVKLTLYVEMPRSVVDKT